MFMQSLLGTKPRAFWLIFLAFLASTVASFGVPFSLPELGLDPSWYQALVEATDHSRVFGKEVIFTYGPLHQLATRQISESFGPVLLGRVIFGLGWIAAVLLAGQKKGLLAALAVSASAFLAPEGHPELDIKFYTLCFTSVLLAYIYATAKRPAIYLPQVDSFSLLLVVLVTVLSMTLVKLSYVGTALPALISGLFFIALPRRNGTISLDIPRLCVSLLALVAILPLIWWITASGDFVHLLKFFSGGNLSIVLGYTDAMSYEPSRVSADKLVRFILSSLVGGAVYLRLMAASLSENFVQRTRGSYFYFLVPTLGLSVIFWVVFKASFVRDDVWHIPIATITGIAFTVVVMSLYREYIRVAFGPVASIKSRASLAFVAVAASISQFALLSLSDEALPRFSLFEYVSGLKDLSLSAVSADYRKAMYQQRIERLADLKRRAEHYSIPPGKTADILPWDIADLLVNNIIYKPRPVPQSYSTYTKDLQLANFKFYQDTSSSPEYVVIDVKEIDERYPLSPDAPAIASILNSYAFSHRGSRGSLVFKKREAQSVQRQPRLELCQEKETVSQLNWRRVSTFAWQTSPIPLPGKKASVSMVNDSPLIQSASRAILSTLYRPFAVYIDYLDSSGRVLGSFRVLPKALSGLVVWPIVESNNSFYTSFVANHAVQGDRLSANSPQADSRFSEAVSFRFRSRGLGRPFSDSPLVIANFCSGR